MIVDPCFVRCPDCGRLNVKDVLNYRGRCTDECREVDHGTEPAAPRYEITPPMIYISGPMTGYPEYNLPAFGVAWGLLADKGLDATNPGRAGVIPGYTWRDYMREALRDLLECNAMAMLPGWSLSKGAVLEHQVGKSLGMDIRELGDWL